MHKVKKNFFWGAACAANEIEGGWDEGGNIQIIHCTSSYNNVVITGKAGFATIGRPMYYTS